MFRMKFLLPLSAIMILLTLISPTQAGGCGRGHYAPSYSYAPSYYTPNYYTPNYYPTYYPPTKVVIQQDYVLEPFVSEVIEIYPYANTAYGAGYPASGYSGYSYYPNSVAVIREVVRQNVVVVPQRTQTTVIQQQVVPQQTAPSGVRSETPAGPMPGSGR